MSRAMGMLLLFLSIDVMVAVVVVPIFLPDVMEQISGVFCDEGEKLRQNTAEYSDSEGSGIAITYDCVNERGQASAATGKILLAGFGLFIVPFLLGMLLISIGRRNRLENGSPFMKVSTFDSGGVGHQTVDVMNFSGKLPQQFQHLNSVINTAITTAFEDMDTFEKPKRGGSVGSLVDKLRELEDALAGNYISQAEYERKRQEILDEF